MLKTFQTILKQTRESYRVPKTVQDLIPISKIYADGIFLCGKRYTKTWRYTDINYKVASQPGTPSVVLTRSSGPGFEQSVPPVLIWMPRIG